MSTQTSTAVQEKTQTQESRPPESGKKTRKCGLPCEIWSRVCGYYRPVANWNRGKLQEFRDRKAYEVKQNIN